MQSGPTRRTVGPLSVRTAGGNRTRDNLVSRTSALSTERQRYAARKIDKFDLVVGRFSFVVDKFGASLFLVGRVLFPISYNENPVSNVGVFSSPSW